jgi:hypothetical protein
VLLFVPGALADFGCGGVELRIARGRQRRRRDGRTHALALYRHALDTVLDTAVDPRNRLFADGRERLRNTAIAVPAL